MKLRLPGRGFGPLNSRDGGRFFEVIQMDDVLSQLRTTACELAERANNARHAFPGLKSADSLAAMTLAHDLSVLGQEFHNLSVKLKQAGRAAADADADARNTASRPLRKNAAQMAADMRRRGAYSVMP